MKNILAALTIGVPVLLATAMDDKTASVVSQAQANQQSWSDEELLRSPPHDEAQYREVLDLVELHRVYLSEARR